MYGNELLIHVLLELQSSGLDNTVSGIAQRVWSRHYVLQYGPYESLRKNTKHNYHRRVRVCLAALVKLGRVQVASYFTARKTTAYKYTYNVQPKSTEGTGHAAYD